MSEINCVMEGREIGTKLVKVEEHEDGSKGSKEGETICERILLILLIKNVRKSSQVSRVASFGTVTGGLSILFMVSNRTLGLFTCLEIISEKYFALSVLTHFC